VWATPGPGGSWTQVAATSHDFTYLYKNGRPHAPSSVGARSISYDDSGNQTFYVDSTTGAARTMVWDDDDRLAQVIDSSSTVSFRYDASGTRTHKVSSAGVTVYVNQYYSVRNGTTVTKHIFAGPQRVASVVDSGLSEQRLFLHTNHLGSTEFVTTATGAVTEHYEQLPFGEGWVEEVGSGGSSVPYRFTGKEIDEETGLYYFGARHYDPATGLWLSADPAMRDYATGNSRSGGMGSPANLNAYGYGWNSPLRMTDPDGREVVNFRQVSATEWTFDLTNSRGAVVASAYVTHNPTFSNNGLVQEAGFTLGPTAFSVVVTPTNRSAAVGLFQTIELSGAVHAQTTSRGAPADRVTHLRGDLGAFQHEPGPHNYSTPQERAVYVDGEGNRPNGPATRAQYPFVTEFRATGSAVMFDQPNLPADVLLARAAHSLREAFRSEFGRRMQIRSVGSQMRLNLHITIDGESVGGVGNTYESVVPKPLPRRAS
jgi:RHS repeat-associated protein